MTRHALAGLALALLTTALVLLSGPDLQGVALLGAALGGALGLVPDRSPGQRAAAFGAGFVAAWIGYVLRAAALPDAAAGRAVAVLVVLGLCLAVAAASRSRLPLWATLLGTAALAGAYEATYTADPSAFVTSSATTATTILLAVGAGFLATSLLGAVVEQDRARERTTPPAPHPQPAPDAQVAQSYAVPNHADPAGPTRRGLPATRPLDAQPEA